MSGGFYYIFKNNMQSMGLEAPNSLFSTQDKAIATASILAKAIDTFGTRVTVAEAIGAGTVSEGLIVIGAMSAAYYLGAVIGSLAVATGVSVAGGVTRSDIFFTARHFDLDRPWLGTVIAEGQ